MSRASPPQRGTCPAMRTRKGHVQWCGTIICKDGTMSAHYDVVIVGGGIAGLSLASTLAGQCSVALIEAEQTLAYHTSARSARQLISELRPARGPGTHRPDAGPMVARRERPEPVLTPPLHADRDDATVQAEASGHMRRITHAEALELCPALVPDSFSAAGLDAGILRLQRPRTARGPQAPRRGGGVDIITGARVHSAQRLGTGWNWAPGRKVSSPPSWSMLPAPGRTNSPS